ncbi:MAG: TIGR02757 family protein, partial [Bradymonadia bacterium]
PCSPRLLTHLNRLHNEAPLEDWLKTDPIKFPKRYKDPRAIETVAIYASLLAYGRVNLIERALEQVTDRMGKDLVTNLLNDTPEQAKQRFSGFVYRLTRGVDLARLWIGLGELFRAYDTVGDALMHWNDQESPDLRSILSRFRQEICSATPGFESRKGFKHFLPDPLGGSAIKRYCMLMRWMVRGPDKIDFGSWRALGTHRLVLPLDTHVHRISRNLGLSTRTSADWKTAMEITQNLKQLDPIDPTRFDFAIAHLGISGSCPTRRVESICSGCPINKVCTLS